MKVLISTAVWGEGYCSIFTKFSLGTLLSANNIPKLAERASITCHIVTREADHQRLLADPAIAMLQGYCTVEWEIIENYGIDRPPEGPGGEKYPFLSALQNLAIRRSVDHDVICFNYADFIWADGSLTRSVDMLTQEGRPLDAVFSFCLPVDRDLAVRRLEEFRQLDNPAVVELAPRDGTKIAVDCIHREAKIRFWEETPRFTNLPSYLIWRVGNQGLLIRSYHQSILAMRVRKDDPSYVRGILRGSLDSSFGGQLATSDALGFAADADEILVFSLYDTIVDSRVPPGVTREMSLRNVLRGDVTPEQRRFAEQPIRLKLCDEDPVLWNRVAEKSWQMLREMQDTTPFDRALYDRNLQTHGVVPRIYKLGFVRRHILPRLKPLIAELQIHALIHAIRSKKRLVLGKLRYGWAILLQPKNWRREIARQLMRTHAGRRAQRLSFVMQHPVLLRSAIRRRISRSLPGGALHHPDDAGIEDLLLDGNADAVEAAFFARVSSFNFAPNIYIESRVHACFAAAIFVETMTARTGDSTGLMVALRTAEELLHRAIKNQPLWIDPVRALGRNLWFQGRFDEAIQTMAAGEELRDEVARVAGWPVNSCVFLPRNCAEVIGLMGHIDAFVKYKKLVDDPRPYYLLAPPQNIINRVFLEYWREYIEVFSEPGELTRLGPFEPVYAAEWNWVLPKEDRMVFSHEGMAAIQRTWEDAGRAPLLQLRPEHAQKLRAARVRWGMKEDDRFICLHVRSVGFYGQSKEQAQRFRNTTIDRYYLLIRELADMGFWVIRMGDGSMPPLDLAECGKSGRVIDYALSADRSPELDVALCAECELFVSSPSGLHTVAHAFGRPVCEVNYPIYSGFPWHPGDIFIPQLYFSHDKGRPLTLEEILGTDVVHLDHHFLLDRAGITLIPNEPRDIVETVKEALSPSSYRVKNEALADEVCAAFNDLNRTYDRGVSGRLGRYFATKYAPQLMAGEAQDQLRRMQPPKGRKLDVLIPCFNRPRYLHRILKSGLALKIPGVYFVVFDDASNAFEDVPGLGSVTVEMVCRSFNDDHVIYTRNPTNLGVAKSLDRYYRELCDAEYTSLLNPKDEFISDTPLVSAIAKLDADPTLSFVVYPLRQVDRSETDKPLLFQYDRMTGREFVAAHVRDPMLQHCSGYAVLRVTALRRCGIPRDLDLRAYGLEDASGIDHEMLFNLATTGDVEFESEAPVRREIVDGYTERFPLTFAYSQYQYARRLMRELEPRGFVSAETRRLYLSFWHLIIARGLVVAYRPVYGSEQERGVRRLRRHLRMPILLYLPFECLRFRVLPRKEALTTYFLGARLLLADWWNKVCGRPHIA